jgi:LuxR family transcriptional regulator, quorum-sensing system regulator SdiA
LNIKLILQCLVLAEETTTEDDLVGQLERLLKAYGFDYYNVTTHSRSGDNPQDLVLASRFPDGWEELYTARKYALIDPAIRMLTAVHRPFRWRDAVMAFRNDPHRQRMQRMTQEGARHGLSDGYCFPVYGRSGLLANLFVGGQPVELSPTEIEMFAAVARKIFWRFMELRGLAEDMEAVAAMDTQFTRREMEVIILLTDGLTSNEIARALDISAHTVDWYINGLQEKLKARNRQHVVASAFRLGLVT